MQQVPHFSTATLRTFQPAFTQGRFSDETALDKERFWYIRALRIGVFLFDGKLGVGFSCRSLGCQREKCPLNLKRKTQRFNRVDIYQLLQIFEGDNLMEAVSKLIIREGKIARDMCHPTGSYPSSSLL
jgi:hypothetical protein